MSSASQPAPYWPCSCRPASLVTTAGSLGSMSMPLAATSPGSAPRTGAPPLAPQVGTAYGVIDKASPPTVACTAGRIPLYASRSRPELAGFSLHGSNEELPDTNIRRLSHACRPSERLAVLSTPRPQTLSRSLLQWTQPAAFADTGVSTASVTLLPALPNTEWLSSLRRETATRRVPITFNA